MTWLLTADKYDFIYVCRAESSGDHVSETHSPAMYMGAMEAVPSTETELLFR